MNPSSRDLRRAAEKAFKDALDQLQETLEVPIPECVEPDVALEQNCSDRALQEFSPIHLADLEDAVADIEEFIRTQHPEADGNT